jgi:hypothetical protein
VSNANRISRGSVPRKGERCGAFLGFGFLRRSNTYIRVGVGFGFLRRSNTYIRVGVTASYGLPNDVYGGGLTSPTAHSW